MRLSPSVSTMAENSAPIETGPTRPASLGGLIPVIASIVLSVASFGPLPDTVRIRWTVGVSHHYGPEYVPTVVALVGFPLFVASLYAGAWWLKAHVARAGKIEDGDEFNAIYDTGLLVTLGTVVAGQFILILLNL